MSVRKLGYRASVQMLPIEKAQKLFAAAHLSSESKSFREAFAASFRYNPITLCEAFCEYMVNSASHNNDLYADIAIRYAMYLETIIPASWHQSRSAFVKDLYTCRRGGTVSEYGFGVLRQFAISEADAFGTTFVMSDAYASAIEFAEFYLHFHCSPEICDRFTFVLHNLDTGAIDVRSDVILLLDSIEHAHNPTRAMKEIISKAPLNVLFGLILPIGELIPSHNIAWRSREEALDWCSIVGVSVTGTKIITPNFEVDIFANGTKGIHGLLVCGLRAE